MIHIRFRGQLGNQMFQYAAARLAAERLSCSLVIEEPPSKSVNAKDVFKNRTAYELFEMFPDLIPDRRGIAISYIRRRFPNMTERCIETLAPTVFTPRNAEFGTLELNEAFDPRYFDIKSGTRLTDVPLI